MIFHRRPRSTPPSPPQFQSAVFAKGATHMCLVHNAIFRGYNSIFHQAAHVPDSEKADFVGYALAWHKFVKSHHDDEEAVLFAKVEQLLGDDTVWAETHREHGELFWSVSLSLLSLLLSTCFFHMSTSPHTRHIRAHII